MDFIEGLPHTQRQHGLIWDIFNMMTKLAHFIPVKATYLAEDYSKLYLNEILIMHEVSLSIISNRVPNLLFIFGKNSKVDLVPR